MSAYTDAVREENLRVYREATGGFVEPPKQPPTLLEKIIADKRSPRILVTGVALGFLGSWLLSYARKR